MTEWSVELPLAVTVCDAEGTLLEMNEAARKTFAAEGGEALLGTNILECHPQPARDTLLRLLGEQKSNVYTITKNGCKKMIYQTPWYRDGVFAGLVEFSLPLPEDVPHFVRH